MTDKKIADELKKMGEADQKARLNVDPLWDEIQKIDKKNTKKLKKIIKVIGWPTISRVGEEASQNAWLIAQHSDLDIEFQKECLRLMSENSHDLLKRNIAYLTDRILVAESKPQIYGTQFVDKDDHLELRPVQDRENLNKVRGEVDLETIEEYKKLMEESYNLPVYI